MVTACALHDLFLRLISIEWNLMTELSDCLMSVREQGELGNERDVHGCLTQVRPGGWDEHQPPMMFSRFPWSRSGGTDIHAL